MTSVPVAVQIHLVEGILGSYPEGIIKYLLVWGFADRFIKVK